MGFTSPSIDRLHNSFGLRGANIVVIICVHGISYLPTEAHCCAHQEHDDLEFRSEVR